MPQLTAVDMAGNWSTPAGWCPGCGVQVTDGDHRPDCVLEPSPLICDETDCDAMRLPSERGPAWQYQPATNTYRCPNHHQKGTTP